MRCSLYATYLGGPFAYYDFTIWQSAIEREREEHLAISAKIFKKKKRGKDHQIKILKSQLNFFSVFKDL